MMHRRDYGDCYRPPKMVIILSEYAERRRAKLRRHRRRINFLLTAIAVALFLLPGCTRGTRVAKFYIKPKADHGPNTGLGAPAGLHHLLVDEELGHAQTGLGAVPQDQGLDGDYATMADIGKIETYDFTETPTDLAECTAIRARMSAFVGTVFIGAGGTVDFPCKVYKSDGTLLGTSVVTLDNDDDGLTPDGDPIWEVFEGTLITGLSLTKAEADAVYASFEVEATGYDVVNGSVLNVNAFDLEGEYSATQTQDVKERVRATIRDRNRVASTIKTRLRKSAPITATYRGVVHDE